jgi:hypothetical protein
MKLKSLTAAVLVASAPASLAEAWRRGGFYLFSRDFLEDIPRRLVGPGRFRFLLKPLVASLLGLRSGRENARVGRPPFLFGVLFRAEARTRLLAPAFGSIINWLLMGILMDSLFQWVLLGTSYPGAALGVGPVLITVPYAVARALAHRGARARGHAV